MSAQPSSVTTLETVEHLDFERETPCEDCDSVAELRVMRLTCPNCGAAPTVWLICASCWVEIVVDGGFTHIACDRPVPVRYCVVLGPVKP